MAHTDRTTESVDTPNRSSARPMGTEGAASPRSGSSATSGFAPQNGQVRPAHPLPAQRSGKLDYDRYLERSTSKFKIFSAEERRKRKRTAIAVAAVLIVVLLIVVWAIWSQG